MNVGRRYVRFQIDAFARAPLDSVDRSLLVATGYGHRRVAGLGHDEPAIVDVPDAILEDDEQVRTVVDAQPGPGAAVLIDPDLHVAPSGTRSYVERRADDIAVPATAGMVASVSVSVERERRILVCEQEEEPRDPHVEASNLEHERAHAGRPAASEQHCEPGHDRDDD